MPIRPALPQDAPRLAEIAQSAYALYLPRMKRAPAPMRQNFPAAIASGHVDVLDIADTAGGDGVPVIAYLVHFPRDGLWFVENIAVDPVRQGEGIGSRLLDYAEGLAAERGYAAVTLYTNSAMTENIAFYRDRGYAETDRRTEDGFDRVYFRKDLPSKGEGDAPDPG